MVDLLNPQPTSGVQERISEWQAYLQKPEIRAALMTAGAAIAQPRAPGQSPFGHIASAVSQGAGAAGNVAENELAERKVQYAGQVQDRQERRAEEQSRRWEGQEARRDRAEETAQSRWFSQQEREQRRADRQERLDMEARERAAKKEAADEARLAREEKRERNRQYQAFTKARSTAAGTNDDGIPLMPYDKLLLDPENTREFERYYSGNYLNPTPAPALPGSNQPAATPPQAPTVQPEAAKPFPNRTRFDPFAGQPIGGAKAEPPAPGNVIDVPVAATFPSKAAYLAAKAASPEAFPAGTVIQIGNTRIRVK